MKKTDLLDIISSPTLAKLSKGETIKTDVIDRICKKLNCQPADIMEYVPDEKIEKSIVKKVIEIPVKEPWEEQMTEEVIDLFWERYEMFQNAISKEKFIDILYTCAYMGKNKQLKVNEEKMLVLLKRYADMSKVDI